MQTQHSSRISRQSASNPSQSDPAHERQRRVRHRPQNMAPRPITFLWAAPDARASSFTYPSPLPWLILGLIFVLIFATRLLWAQPLHSVSVASAPTASYVPGHLSGYTLHPVQFAWQMTLVVALICLNAFFAIAEYALITVRKTRIAHLVEEGSRNARLVQRLLENPTRMMATIQTGVTVIATLSSALAAFAAVEPLANTLIANGFPTRAHTVALLLVTLPVALLSLIVGEIAPKSLAVRFPERFALIAVHPIYWLQNVLTPAVVLITWLSNHLVRPFGGTASFTVPAVNKEELEILVEQSEEQGVLESAATEMIHSILDFGETVARKVMTPRIDLSAIDADCSLSELIALVTNSGHSRIPVYEGDLDNIIGIVHAKDLLTLNTDGVRDQMAIRAVMRAAYFIPETKKVDELLKEFRRSRQQLAIVRDEYGVTSGLVTIEDLLEEIVGDIQDEYDTEEPMVQVLDATTTICDGKLGLSEVNDRLGLELPEEEADTIGGFVFGLLGHQAAQGETVSFEGMVFVVEATDGRRITKVRILRQNPNRKEADGDSDNMAELPSQNSEPTPRYIGALPGGNASSR